MPPEEESCCSYKGCRGQIGRFSELRHACPCVHPVAIGRVRTYSLAIGDLSFDKHRRAGQQSEQLCEKHLDALGTEVSRDSCAMAAEVRIISSPGQIAEKRRANIKIASAICPKPGFWLKTDGFATRACVTTGVRGRMGIDG